ncbi:MAG: pyridoxal phosphate-dependent aminotransferase [Methanobrevibacter sp.]|nr:pyridoxal phosphate-dependent aminotransferase [Candidatus Methanovirga aequatorialis]
MKYDFNKVYDRKNTSSTKWDGMKENFGKDDLIPMWIADMDFPVAEPIKKAIKSRADYPFYGYSKIKNSLINVIVKRVWDKFQWRIEKEWIVFTPGVISGINIAIRTVANSGDGIVIQQPVYHLFFSSIMNSGCQIVNNPLKFDNGNYEMDFKNLTEIAEESKENGSKSKSIDAILLCNPHNPIGRVWRKEELLELGKIAVKNDLFVISDEIHSEIIYKGYKHQPFASLSKEFEENSITSISPSKTFNLAGLNVSSMIIPNKKIREKFKDTMAGIVSQPNIFALEAFEAGFKYGDPWLNDVLEYLQENLDFMINYFKDIKGIKPIRAEGTYLIWLDCRKLNLKQADLKDLMINDAKVGLEDGTIFGDGGEGFMRMNIALPRSLLEEALRRIKTTVDKL